MQDFKIVSTPLDHHNKLLIMKCPQTREMKNLMEIAPDSISCGWKNDVWYDL